MSLYHSFVYILLLLPKVAAVVLVVAGLCLTMVQRATTVSVSIGSFRLYSV